MLAHATVFDMLEAAAVVEPQLFVPINNLLKSRLISSLDEAIVEVALIARE